MGILNRAARHFRAILIANTIMVVAGLSLFWMGTATANGGPHGGYSGTTDACATCHRTHGAPSSRLLVVGSTGLCLTCHGGGATGAETNVVDGVYEGHTYGTQSAGLNGGGFVNAVQNTSLGGPPSSAPVSSIHSIEGTGTYSPNATMWGYGSFNSGVGAPSDLYCVSCHDPHGSNNYRLIKTSINGVTVAVTPTDEASKSYTSPKYYGGGAQWQISSFCGACHTRYLATMSASGEISSTDTTYPFQHRVDAPSGAVVNGISYTFTAGISLPVSTVNGAPPATSPDNRSMVCLTCHYAHGSRAVMGAYSGAVPWPGGGSAPSGDARSSLLRLDNRGVCENCHAK